MSISDSFRAMLRAIKHLMRETPNDSVQRMAPESPMSLSQNKPQLVSEPVAMSRPWAALKATPHFQKPDTQLDRLRRRLRQPETLRDSIILKEIIDRPLARRRR